MAFVFSWCFLTIRKNIEFHQPGINNHISVMNEYKNTQQLSQLCHHNCSFKALITNSRVVLLNRPTRESRDQFIKLLLENIELLCLDKTKEKY